LSESLSEERSEHLRERYRHGSRTKGRKQGIRGKNNKSKSRVQIAREQSQHLYNRYKLRVCVNT